MVVVVVVDVGFFFELYWARLVSLALSLTVVSRVYTSLSLPLKYTHSLSLSLF